MEGKLKNSYAKMKVTILCCIKYISTAFEEKNELLKTDFLLLPVRNCL